MWILDVIFNWGIIYYGKYIGDSLNYHFGATFDELDTYTNTEANILFSGLFNEKQSKTNYMWVEFEKTLNYLHCLRMFLGTSKT